MNQLKPKEIKSSMLFNLVFANNAILSCFFFFFLLHAEFVISIGVQTKEAKAEIETHPVTAEAKISKCSI